jgi:hypothetical protein
MNPERPNIIPFPGQSPRGALVLWVELVLAPYPVWRRLRIDDLATFWDLHVAIQDAMGWSHRHRHLFTADDPESGERLRLGIPESGAFHGRQAVLPGWQHRVVDLARPDHPPFLYTYHLGEEWQHEVSLEAIEDPATAGPAPACLEGEGACPVEGCGGPARFAELIRVGGPLLPPEFAPDRFDPGEVVFCDPAQRWQDLFGDD